MKGKKGHVERKKEYEGLVKRKKVKVRMED